MKRKIIFLVLGVMLLVVHTFAPYRKAAAFISEVKSADPGRINALMPGDVSFRQYPGINGWFGFYSSEKMLIGPFPLQNYSQDNTLNLHVETPSFMDWILGRRAVRVFGKQFTKQFVVSYFGISYKQGVDPEGQAG